MPNKATGPHSPVPPPRPEGGGDRLRGPLAIGLSTAALVLFCLVVSALLFHHFSAKRPMQSTSSLGIITAPDQAPFTRFAGPGLYIDEGRAERIALQEQQSQKLNRYGWGDRRKGIVHIPIDRAMDWMTRSDTNTLVAATNAASLRFSPERTVSR